MKKIIHYFILSLFILQTVPLDAQSTQENVSRLNRAKKSVKKHLAALSDCIHRKKCTKEAYKAATVSIVSLLLLIWGSIGIVILKKKRAKAREELEMAQKPVIIHRPIAKPTQQPSPVKPSESIKPSQMPLFESVEPGQDPLSKLTETP
jgi:hypothetical protein